LKGVPLWLKATSWGTGTVKRTTWAAAARQGLIFLALMGSRALAEPAKQDSSKEGSFIRVTRDDQRQPLALETAISHYLGEHPKGGTVEVDLVAAIHVADAAYFEQLNRRFTGYDAVLYELVAPEGTRIPRDAPVASAHPVGMAQQGLTSLLGLAFQLESIDYTADNFRHADLSPAEFAESMDAKDESFAKMLLRIMGQSMAMQAKQPAATSDFRLFSALFAEDRELQLKRIMAEQMTQMEELVEAFEGPGGSTLVSVRNERAVDVLEREIAAGKRKLAIFYGAAHMPDMARRLKDRLDLQLDQQTWLAAWDLRGDR
jgi:hypothetical protein